MGRLEKAQKELEDKGITTNIENGTLYVCIDETQLELSDFEIDYQAQSFDDQKEEL